MKAGDLVRFGRLHRMVGLVRKVRPFGNRENLVYVQWHTIHQSHGNRWFDEGELVVISETK